MRWNGGADDRRVANLLRALALGVSDAIARTIPHDAGLDLTSATALVALLDFTPSGSVQQLSTVIGLTHSGCVRLVDRLSAGRFVNRKPGDDARTLSVALTGPGRRVAHRIRREQERVLLETLAALRGPQRAELTSALEIMLATLARERLAIRQAGEVPDGGALCRLCDFTACGRPQGRCPVADAVTPRRDTSSTRRRSQRGGRRAG